MRCNPKRFLFGGGGHPLVSLEIVVFITHTHMIQIFSSLFSNVHTVTYISLPAVYTVLRFANHVELRKREVDSEIITV